MGIQDAVEYGFVVSKEGRLVDYDLVGHVAPQQVLGVW